MKPRINLEELLVRVENDGKLLKDLVEIFRAVLPGHLSALEAAVEAANPPQVVRNAHSLKGMLANMAAPQAASAAAHLEKLGRENQSLEFGSALAALEDELAGLLPELEAAAAEEPIENPNRR